MGYSILLNLINNNNNNYTKNQNQNDNSILFFKVWRSKFLNNEIFKESRLFNENYEKKFNNLKSLRLYKKKEYIKKLILSQCTGEVIYKDIIPSSVINLELSDEFNGSINRINSSITILKIGKNFKSKLEIGSIPSTVKILSLGFDLHNTYEYKPQPQPQLQQQKNINNMEMIYCAMSSGKNQEKINYPIGIIPSSVTELSIIGDFKYGDIPESCTKLSISTNSNHQYNLLKFLPSSVTSLSFLDFGLMQFINRGFFPSQIIHLDLGKHFDQTLLKHCLPSSLKLLILGHYFNAYLEPNSFPDQLEYIKFGYKFSHPFTSDIIIPESLKTIIFSVNYRFSSETDVILSQYNFKRYNNYFIR